MVVDDDKFILFATKELLKPEGYEVITVDNGKKCIRELEKGFRGVILLDIMMPQLNGWDAIREIVKKNLYPGNCIVIFTAIDIQEKEIEDIKDYITDYITKPFDPDKLVLRIREYMKKIRDLNSGD